MGKQLSLFERFPEPLVSSSDSDAGQRLKEAGMMQAADNRRDVLSYAQKVARDLAIENGGLCHMDLVREALPPEIELGAAAGSVFKGDCWEFTGQRIRSRLPKNHARELKVWIFIGEGE